MQLRILHFYRSLKAYSAKIFNKQTCKGMAGTLGMAGIPIVQKSVDADSMWPSQTKFI